MKSKTVVTMGWREGRTGNVSWVENFSWENKKVLKTGGGDGCTPMVIHLISQNCSLKSAKKGKLYVMLFYHS